nr:reverse transcriptase domain-containing protein [Tanacetum cinerariifolium]
MHQDARDMIQKCNDCQIHRLITRSPQQPLTPITASWSFYKWGIDIAGPFPEGQSCGSGREARTKVRRTLRGNRGVMRWSIQTAVYGRNNSPKDMEHCQS